MKPELLIGVPAGITSTERRAVVEAGLAAGAKAVFIAKEPVASSKIATKQEVSVESITVIVSANPALATLRLAT